MVRDNDGSKVNCWTCRHNLFRDIVHPMAAWLPGRWTDITHHNVTGLNGLGYPHHLLGCLLQCLGWTVVYCAAAVVLVWDTGCTTRAKGWHGVSHISQIPTTPPRITPVCCTISSTCHRTHLVNCRIPGSPCTASSVIYCPPWVPDRHGV